MREDDLDAILDEKNNAEKIIELIDVKVKMVVFTLGAFHFALAGRVVKEILNGDEPIYFVPGMPKTLEGVVHLRDDIESVMSLSQLINLPVNQCDSASSSLLLVETDLMKTLLRVDKLIDVVDISESDIKPKPDALPQKIAEVVNEIFMFNDHLVAVMDIHRVLAFWESSTA